MRNFKLKRLRKAKKVITYLAVFSLVLNSSFIGELVPETKAAATDVVINEVYANGSPEWVEIYNKGTDPVDINGWTIENSISQNFATLSGDISPGKFKFYEKSSPILNDGGDTVYLKGNASIPNEYTYASFASGSWARKPDGIGAFMDDVTPTKGTVNNQAPYTTTLSGPADGTIQSIVNVDFSWTSPVPADPDFDPVTYTLQVDDNSDFSSTLHNISGVSSPYPVGSLSDDTYYWRVGSGDGFSNTQWSLLRSFTIDTVAPAITGSNALPNPFSPNDNGNMDTTIVSYNLSENTDVDVKIYDATDTLFRTLISSSPRNEGLNQEIWNGKDDLSNVVEGTYKAKITATDLAGNSTQIQINGIVIDTTGPSPTSGSYINTSNPTNNNNPGVVGNYDTTDTAKVVAVFGAGTTQYQKEATLDAFGNYTTVNGNPYAVTDLVIITGVPPVSVLPDGTYSVAVLAYDAAGNAVSETVLSSFTVDTQAPLPPTNLQVTAKTPSSITLNWTSSLSGDTAGYRLYWGTEEGKYTNVRDVGSSTKAEITGFSSNTVYYFQVTAYDNASNESLGSNMLRERTASALSSSLSGSVTSGSSADGDQEQAKDSGVVESAQAAGEDENGEVVGDEEEDTKTAGTKRNNLFLISIILLIVGVAGYYYQSVNPEKFKNVKFPKIPGLNK